MQGQHSEVQGARGNGGVLATPHVCAGCSKLYAVVPGAPGSMSLQCSCGGDLVPAPLPPGLYELGGAKKKRRRKKAAAHVASPTPREPDQGYNESHGYGPSHGGPTSPGDAPAADAPIAPKPPEEKTPPPSEKHERLSPDGPGSAPQT